MLVTFQFISLQVGKQDFTQVKSSFTSLQVVKQDFTQNQSVIEMREN